MFVSWKNSNGDGIEVCERSLNIQFLILLGVEVVTRKFVSLSVFFRNFTDIWVTVITVKKIFFFYYFSKKIII